MHVSGDVRSFAFGELLAGKDGTLDYSRHEGFNYPLVAALAEKVFPCEPHGGDILHDGKQSVPCVEMPLEGLTDATLGILEKLIIAKAMLIKKAVGAETLPIERTETTLRFSWFSAHA